MKGKVRSRERYCPEGHGKLIIIEEIDIRCNACNYRPKTFYIDLYHQGRHKITRGKDGEMLTSYRQAHRLLENIRFEIDARVFSISRFLPKEIEEFRGHKLFPRWLAAKINIAPITIREYKRYMNLYFLPFFGQFDLRDVNAGKIEDFFQWIPEKQREMKYKQLSLKTLKNISMTLHNFCSWLLRREAIAKTPAFPAINPPDPVIECISRELQERVLEALPEAHRPFFSFLIYHPVRPGEARALRRRHFNLENMTVHIAEAWSLKEIRPRKNKRDYYLPLSDRFDISLLSDKLPEAFAFTNQAGRTYKAENIRRIWHRACMNAGVPHIKLYNGTRHSTATHLLVKAEGNLYLIKEALGHSSVKMTEKYAKFKVETLRRLMNTTAQVSHIEEKAK